MTYSDIFGRLLQPVDMFHAVPSMQQSGHIVEPSVRTSEKFWCGTGWSHLSAEVRSSGVERGATLSSLGIFDASEHSWWYLSCMLDMSRPWEFCVIPCDEHWDRIAK